MKFLATLVFALIGTSVFAQTEVVTKTDEERLVECIEQSQRIIKFTFAHKTTLENLGFTARGFDIAEIFLSYSVFPMFAPAFEMLEQRVDHEKILEALEEKEVEYQLKYKLVKNMADEAIEDENSFQAMANFIAECSNNYGGETTSSATLISSLTNKLISEEQKRKESEAKVLELETQLAFTSQAERKKAQSEYSAEKKELLADIERLKMGYEGAIKMHKDRLKKICDWIKLRPDAPSILKQGVHYQAHFYFSCEP